MLDCLYGKYWAVSSGNCTDNTPLVGAEKRRERKTKGDVALDNGT